MQPQSFIQIEGMFHVCSFLGCLFLLSVLESSLWKPATLKILALTFNLLVPDLVFFIFQRMMDGSQMGISWKMDAKQKSSHFDSAVWRRKVLLWSRGGHFNRLWIHWFVHPPQVLHHLFLLYWPKWNGEARLFSKVAVFLRVCVCVCVDEFVCVCVRVCKCECVCVCVCVYECVCMCISLFVYEFARVCVCVWVCVCAEHRY